MSQEKIVKSYYDEIIIDYNNDDLDEIPEYVRFVMDFDRCSGKAGIRISSGISFLIEPEHAVMLGEWLTDSGRLLSEKGNES